MTLISMTVTGRINVRREVLGFIMKITTARIHNWRSIKDVKIVFERMVVFIGQNNHGKSIDLLPARQFVRILSANFLYESQEHRP